MSERTSAAWPNGMPKVGQRAERSRYVKPEYIRLYTEISGDENPMHYDEEFARSTKIGEIVVQGGITTSILNAVCAEDLPGPGSLFMQTDWKFLAPVRPGATITGAIEVLEVREDKPILKLRTTVTRQDGVVVVDGTAVAYTMPVKRE